MCITSESGAQCCDDAGKSGVITGRDFPVCCQVPSCHKVVKQKGELSHDLCTQFTSCLELETCQFLCTQCKYMCTSLEKEWITPMLLPFLT